MRTLALASAIAVTALVIGTAAQAAPPPPDNLPGTIHFDSGSSNVKARQARNKKKPVRRTGNATMNKNAARDGTGKQ